MILILGGTGEAHQLASALEPVTEILVTLAGVTKNPPERSYPTHVGGVGGASGLADFLTSNNVDALIDMTHPFAANMSVSACWAAEETNTPLLRFNRKGWPEIQGVNWQHVASFDEAANALPNGARAFLTVGSGSLAPFADRSDVWFLFRGIEKAEMPFEHGEMVLQRPPFTVESEIKLMRDHKITHLVTKNSGGPKTFAKIRAAKRLGIPVISIERPELPVAETADSIPEILAWLKTKGTMR